MDGRPIVARPVGTLERALKWARRRPALAGLLAVVPLVAAVAFALVAWQWREAVSQKELADARTGEAQQAEHRAANAAREADGLRRAAAAFSSNRSMRPVPAIGTMSSPRLNNQASASCAGVAPSYRRGWSSG